MSDQFRTELKRVLGFKLHQAALIINEKRLSTVKRMTLKTSAARNGSGNNGAITTTTTTTTKENDILTTVFRR